MTVSLLFYPFHNRAINFRPRDPASTQRYKGWLIEGESAPYSAMIVVVQSATIIVFYSAIVYVQPYSRGFFAGILGMQSRIKERYSEAWTQGLRYALTAAVVITVAGTISIAVIVLLGVTYKSFTPVGAGMLILIFLAQMIAVRHLQGGYSRTLVHSLLSSWLETIREEVLPAIGDLDPASESGAVTPLMVEESERITHDLVRYRALRIDYASLFGYFTVCMVTPDVGAIMRLAGAGDGGHGRNTVDGVAA